MPTTKTQLQYVVLPHPDDEIEAWAMIANASDNYPVFLLMTQGESTGFCDGSGLQADLGERVPQPQPFTGRGSPNCRAQRIDAWHAFLDAMAAVDPYLDARADMESADFAGFDWSIGSRSARVVCDGGDGSLATDYVTSAVAEVRANRARLPVEQEFGIIASAYYNADVAGSFEYTHPDHKAVQDAVFGTDFGLPGPRWGRCASGDARTAGAGQGRTQAIDPATYRAIMAVDPDGTRRGAAQVCYGWLAFQPGGSWLAAESDATTSWNRIQTFWVRIGGTG